MPAQYFEVYGHYGVIPSGLYDFTSEVIYATNVESDDFIIASPVKREINKAGSFEFDILPTHFAYSRMYKYYTYISVEEIDNNNRTIIFYGKIVDVSIDFNNIKHVSCEGILGDLLDYPMFNPDPDQDPDEKPLQEKFNDMTYYPPTSAFALSFVAFQLISGREDIKCSSIISIRDVPNYGRVIEGSGCINSTIGDFIKSQLLDAFGGYLSTSYSKDSNGQIISRIDWRDDPSSSYYSGSTNSQIIELGSNLISFESEYSNDDPTTGLVVIAEITTQTESGYDQRTEININYKDMDGHTYCVPGVMGDNRIVKPVTIPNVSDWSEASTMASRYHQRYNSYDFTEFDKFTVKAIDLHYFGSSNLPKLEIGDMIRLKSADHNLNKVLWCISKELDINNQLNNVYVLSDFRPTVSSNSKALSYILKK